MIVPNFQVWGLEDKYLLQSLVNNSIGQCYRPVDKALESVDKSGNLSLENGIYFHNYIALKSFPTKSLLPVILECQIVAFELTMNNVVIKCGHRATLRMSVVIWLWIELR